MGVIQGSGTFKTETREVSGISAIELDTSGHLTVSQGDNESLTIEADDNLLPLLTSDVTNGTLKLDTKPGSSMNSTKPIQYVAVVKNLAAIKLSSSGTITMGDLTGAESFQIEGDGSGDMTFGAVQTTAAKVNLSASGSVTIASLTSDNLSIQVDGSGDAALTDVDTQSLSAKLSASGMLTISGATSDQAVQIDGSGRYNGENLTSKTAVVSTNASGDATIQVSDSLNATVTGSGSIIYTGSPTLLQKVDGSGRVTQKS